MRERRHVVGIAVTLAVHLAAGGLLYWYRMPRPAPPVQETWMNLVQVRPPRAQPKPVIAPPRAAAPRQRQTAPAPLAETTMTLIAPPVAAPAAPASVPSTPSLDMSAARNVVAAAAREAGTPALDPASRRAAGYETRDEKLGRAIDQAHKPDCKDAYRGLGLLALIPLAKNALSKDSACRW